ncbi:MAG: hypothetical protein ABUL46_04450 [Chitinophaga rupis]
MELNAIKKNAASLYAELQWLALVIDTRMKLYWGQESDYEEIEEVSPPGLEGDDSPYAAFVRQRGLSVSERLVLLLALAPHIQPHLLDVFFTKNAAYDRGFTEFGGIRGQHHGGFIPTGRQRLLFWRREILKSGSGC